MSASIMLECPKCRRTMADCTRQEDDPPSAVRVVLICNRCDDGDFHSPAYFDAAGREVLWCEGREAELDQIDANLAGRAALEQGRGHASDCAIHNAPAYEPGPCDCGALPPQGE